jgi:hypothetical protein
VPRRFDPTRGLGGLGRARCPVAPEERVEQFGRKRFIVVDPVFDEQEPNTLGGQPQSDDPGLALVFEEVSTISFGISQNRHRHPLRAGKKLAVLDELLLDDADLIRETRPRNGTLDAFLTFPSYPTEAGAW